MIVDIEHPCILNGAILFQLFQGQKVMPADFLQAVKASLAAGYGQWNLPVPHLFWASLKPHRAETDHIFCIQFVTIVCCAVLIQIQGACFYFDSA